MAQDKKTIRLLFPQWQGGNNPDYVFGGELLAQIAPKSNTDETFEVEVDTDFEKKLEVENGLTGGDVISEQMEKTAAILEEQQPDKIIIFGGDCSMDQVPFDYLSGKYGDKLGILWLDAHPDIATKNDSTNVHEMVAANLLGKGAPQFVTEVKNPVSLSHMMYAGLIEKDLRDRDKLVKELNVRFVGPDELKGNSRPIIDWIEENKIEYLAVHFDLDVLSPKDFRSIYPAEPYTKAEDFPAAVGEMKLVEVVRVLNDVSVKADIVGLGIAEHLPWDAINLRKALSEISIFNN
ncbi:arginase family protein [Oceanobacillus neutriphilus]|uniref:Arginase n=1 Tax=Oceanobacillus neutriphilus TaxID=531815 RepID=A0ABQ2NR97_9BACI|nr:arginase family protein [Oceanobacillus neutriphilus]GGP08482.1 arginase [Oceanobacillus neutriphilus]